MTEQTATILVIEDDRQIRRVVQGYLEQAGYHVLTAMDGDTGLALAQHERPALVVLDLMLPGLDGWEATKRIKSQPETRHIPVIALSAHAMTGNREKALAAGCDDFDTKPVEMPRLLSKVRALLSKEVAP